MIVLSLGAAMIACATLSCLLLLLDLDRSRKAAARSRSS